MSGYRLFLLSGVLLAAALTQAAPAPKTNVGEWSRVVNGLQGRLAVSEGTLFNGTGMPVVYLELRNVSDVGSPLEIYYDPGKGVPGTLTDAAGTPVPQAGLPADIMSPLPFWLAIPYDGTLRFRVSVTGYGVPKDERALIGLSNAAWLIKKGDTGRYFLSGRFEETSPAQAGHIHAWKGTLELPKAEVP